jgi:hypothetical protein
MEKSFPIVFGYVENRVGRSGTDADAARSADF